MKHPQDPRFKRYLKMAYGVFWGGQFLFMLITYLATQIFNDNLDSMALYFMGPPLLIIFSGAVLLLIGNCYLNLTSNIILNRILGLLSFIIQAGANFALFAFIWFLFLVYALKISPC